MIKKCMFCLILLVMSPWAFGQSIDDLFSSYSKTKNAENVSIGKFLMTFAKPFIKDAKGVDSIHVLDLSECSNDVKNEFAGKVRNLKDGKYETLVRSNEDGEDTRVLICINKQAIRELVVIQTGNESTLVRIKGKFKQSDIASLVNK